MGKRNSVSMMLVSRWTIVAAVGICASIIATAPGTSSFVVRPHPAALLVESHPRASSPLSMCICIDCSRVTNCAAYHFVETKHEQPHMTDDPTFEPREGSPTIHVNVRTIRNSEDREREIQRMWREHEGETERAQQQQQQGDEQGETPVLFGETTYDLSPVTTYEYDVVKCEDFVQDVGAWVRNMPQEIRDANPDFVPT